MAVVNHMRVNPTNVCAKSFFAGLTADRHSEASWVENQPGVRWKLKTFEDSKHLESNVLLESMPGICHRHHRPCLCKRKTIAG